MGDANLSRRLLPFLVTGFLKRASSKRKYLPYLMVNMLGFKTGAAT